ncbi:alpha-amylase family glycosyl hydrolase [Thioclava sp. A2]|uniref:alpha-amylase family glycosyl hydrolase n=1 Tax=Thioclava sp. FCG-A2 TaxID=3080562 RepID=UPI0029531CC8|nr:alpha-amylase family glycosyl hydrolase [Thioclava sp. A2]MDV7269773.1 alpha-amylase family glycosyl hydrolase [Thioclava sp. A2]
MKLLDKNPDWWRGAVIYQIYPRSYQDSNGDGIGDLAGITRRLPYIASLGVDAIWISPFFTSPMKDFGYDVSNYCDVDPMFGSLGDFDAMISAAHGLGLKVMIDLVLSHTSDQHPWFAESRHSRTNDKSDWYVWADPKPDGTPPNNWLSIFGGPAWHWDARREQYYLHNFLVSQPDLNFHNADVQQELLGVSKFWLERGVDGFRLDTINFYMHDAELRDNPPLPVEERNDSIAPKVNPYNHQHHLYDKNHPQNIEFLKKLRALMDGYNAAAVGEIGDSQRGLEILGEYTSGTDKMQMSYAFELLSGHEPLPASYFVEVFDRLQQAAPNGWACWAYSNHDVVRHISRWGLSDASARTYIALLMCLKGSVCIYQGEELGLAESEIAYEDLQDPYGIEFWPEFKGRDGCRTPMAWENAPNGGFTDGPKAWLPVAPAHLPLSVAEAEKDEGSLLHAYRRAIALRQNQPALRGGDLAAMKADGGVLSFQRVGAEGAVLCVFNLSDAPASFSADGATPLEAGLSAPDAAGMIVLAPWQFTLLALDKGGQNG